MRFRLWGTRGSIPSPLRSEEIEAKICAALSAAAEAAVDLSDPSAVRAFVASLPLIIRGTTGGDTSCMEVRSAGNLLIFDCGSGIRRLGLELMKEEFRRGEGVAHIFMCHTHWDHMIGWPFFVPGFIRGNRFYIYGVHPDLEGRFRLQQTAPSMFPQPLDYQSSTIQFITLQEGETIEIGQTRVRNLRFQHPGDSFGYRVEDKDGTLVYAGDSEFKTLDPAATQQYVEFFRDADALVFDSMFSWQDAFRLEDWGHSSAVVGVDLAIRAGVRRLLLFHHAPASTDEEIRDLRDVAEEYLKQHPERPRCEIIVAYDGLEMELWRQATLEAHPEQLQEGIAVHLGGRLVGETASVALTAIEQAAGQAGDRHVVIDLEGVSHLDQEGLRALLSARRRWRPVAFSGLSAELQRTLGKAGALDYLAIYDTPSNALVAVKQGLGLHPGQLLGDRYKIDERVERGPVGDWYRATDQSSRRQVTILVICPSLGRLPIEALMDTAQGLANLRHPLISDILDAGQDGDIRYLVTEYTPGRSIKQLLAPRTSSEMDTGGLSGTARTKDKSRSISPLQAVRISAQIAQALEHAHSQDVVHGGLNPEDIVLLEDNSIKLTNLGVGRLEIDRPLSELPVHMGPLNYFAPEQLKGHGNSPSSDLYALGTILYEMLAGRPPFASADNGEYAISLQLQQPPVPPRRHNVNVSRSLEHLVLNLLQKTPQERYSAASVVYQMLMNLDHQRDQRPWVGQDALRQMLHDHLERVAQGESGLLVGHGQRGIGKSRLVLSAAGQWEAKHPLTTIHGELFAYEDSRTYKLFAGSLRRTLLSLPAHRLSQLLDNLGDLSRPLMVLIPELQPALSALTPSDVDCQYLEDAVCETLRLLTGRGPVTLILDGMQWIDAASLSLFERLARQRIPHLLIVALYRSAEIDPEHPLLHTLKALGSWIDQQLDVTPLDPIAVHQMVLRVDTHFPPDFGLWLYSETNGNPLHIEQLMQAYLEGPGETRYPHERAKTMTMEEVIQRRLERLPDGALVTLRQAAVLGHTFHFDRLRAVLAEPERQVLANLDSALQASLILGHTLQDLYRFSHPLIREVIYTEMLDGVRKRYHARAAHVLEQTGVAGLLDEKVEVLAHHFLHAGKAEKALAWLAHATRRARELCAHKAALNYVNQALTIVEQLSRTAANERELEQRRKQRDDLLDARAKLEKLSTQ